MAAYGMYNGMGGYGSQPYNAGYQPQVMPQPQLRTNKVFVTSLEDALNRYAEPNTIMVYRHQDEKFEYEIMTDVQGKKTYKTLVLTDYSAVDTRKNEGGVVVAQEQLNAIQSKLEALEGKVAALEAERKKEPKRIEKNGGAEQ